jgi:2-aminoadipate transaminase
MMSGNAPLDFGQLFAHNAPAGRPLGTARRGTYDFAVAYPDPSSIPLDDLVEGLREALAEEGEDLALYASAQGYTPLREYVANKLARDRAIHVTADDIILGDGSGQPIHMIAETLLNPGDVVIVEDFVYSGTLSTFRRFQADLRGVACDDEGMIMDALEGVIRKAIADGKPPKLIYTVPTFQNPQGWTMSLERRKALVALARQYGIPILEDDCYVDLRFEGNDVPSIYSLDDSGHVLYVASFSKIIAPGMRLGYMTAPRPVLERALAVKSGGAVNTFAAFAVHRYATGQLHSHIEEIVDIQREKRDAMLEALEEHFGDQATWSRPQGGLYLWVTLPEGADVVAVREKILAIDDVGYHPGTNFAADGVSGRNIMRLCFGYCSPAQIREGIAALARGLRREGVLAERTTN